MKEYNDPFSTSFNGKWTTDIYGNPYVIEDDPVNIEFRKYYMELFKIKDDEL